MLRCRTPTGEPVEIAVEQLVLTGWAGRDPAVVQAHIRKLAILRVTPPSRVPLFYRVGAGNLTVADQIQVLGGDSSGEVEVVLLITDTDIWVTVGSDHTDRKVEAYSVAVSKQLCPKPIASEVWPFTEVAEHWDRLELRAHILFEGHRELYQAGTLADLLPPHILLEKFCGSRDYPPPATALFCGTLPVQDGIRSAPRFEMELIDPVLNRRIRHGYDIIELPLVA